MKKSSSAGTAQAVLILIARIAWGMYQSFIKSFTAFNAKYTESYGKDALEAANAAAGLPSNEEIKGVVTGFANKLKAAGLTATDLWQMLTKYIEDTFDPMDWVAAKNEAGAAFYKKAARNNWAFVTSLLEAGSSFIEKYKDQLSPAGSGMPAAFPEQFSSAKLAFETALQDFSIARQNAKLQTASRVATYRSVHTILLAMLKDAQRIFKNDPANKKAFTFSSIRQTVAPKESGVHISIKEVVSLVPVTEANIQLQPGNINFDANAKGIATTKLKAGTYSGTVTMPGYQTISLTEIKITNGVVHRIRLEAVKDIAKIKK